MFFSVLSFAVGIIAVQQLSSLPELAWTLILLLLVFCFVRMRYWRLMFFTAGVLWAIVFATIRLADRLPEQFQGQVIVIEGKVVGLPRYDERKVRFDFAVVKPSDHFPDKIRLSWYFPQQQVKSGQYWQFTVKLKQPHGRLNPHAFDYERWLFMQNISATGYVRKKPQAKLIDSASSWHSIDKLRQAIADNLNAYAKNINHIAVIKALTIGDRQNITQQQWEVFRKTGTVHLLAISGLHIGLISGLMFFLVLKVSSRQTVISAQVVAAVSSVLVALFYAALAGFSLPTQRALIMLFIVMIAIGWQRNNTSINTLAVALFAVLLFDPLSVLSVGFWLSFFAVALIRYSLAGRLVKIGYWHSALKIHWVTAIGLAPLLLFYFQQVSIISPVANLVTVPVVSLIVVPLGLLAIILMPVSKLLAEQILLFINAIIEKLVWLLSSMAELPYAAVTTAALPFYVIPLAIVGVFILLLPKGVPTRWLGVVLMLPVIFAEIKKPAQGEIVLTLLDVGQGLSAVIETSTHVLVFDTGAKYSSNYDMGSAVVVPFLKSKGIKIVDTLLISHADNDHIGGAESIYTELQVNNTLTSVPGSLASHYAQQCLAGQNWVWDGVYFEVLSPILGALASENDNSCVLKVNSKNGSVLLTGDIERQAERGLLESSSQKLASDVMIAPHHGSKTSSSFAFLKRVDPQIVLISAGYKNKFAFPHEVVMQRYKKIKAKIFNTAKQGGIVVRLRKHKPEVNTLRKNQGKYWNK